MYLLLRRSYTYLSSIMPRAGKFSVHKFESISGKGGAAIVPKVKVNDGIYQTFFGFILVPVDLNDCVFVMCDDSDSDSLGIKVKERDDVANEFFAT